MSHHQPLVLTAIGHEPNGLPRTYRLEPRASTDAAYRRLAIAILGLDVATLVSELRSVRPARATTRLREAA